MSNVRMAERGTADGPGAAGPAARPGSSEGRDEVDRLANARLCINDVHTCLMRAETMPDMADHWQRQAATWADRAIWWAQHAPPVVPA